MADDAGGRKRRLNVSLMKMGFAVVPSPCRFAASLSPRERGDPFPLGGGKVDARSAAG